MEKIRPDYVGVYVVDPRCTPEPHYLLLKRCGKFLPGIWQMVTGKVEVGENTIDAAFRELQEETGLVVDKMFSVDVLAFYNRDKDAISFSANFCAFSSMDQPVHLSSTEHSEFKWVTWKEAASLLAFPEQVMVLKKIHDYYVLQETHKANQVSLRT